MPYDAGAVDAGRRSRFEAIEAARLARAGIVSPPPRPPAKAAPLSAEWKANFRGPLPSPANRAPRSCGLCGSREHDRRNHARVIGQETPTGILPPAPAPEPAAPPAPVDAIPLELADEPAVAFQERARALAEKRGEGRSVTIPVHGTTLKEKRSFALTVLAPEDEALRPRTRGDCANVPRPCPFVSCSFHLYLDVSPLSGSIKLNHPGKEPWDLAETCALDVADKGGSTLEEVGDLIGLTRERIRQMEVRGIAALRLVMPDAAEPDTHAPATFNPFVIETP